MAATRAARIARIKREAPEQSIFEGFGGSAVKQETLVFTLHNAPYGPYSTEVRIPVFPEHFPAEQVATEYGCYAGNTWAEVLEQF